jgi:hypothetical protein
MLVERDQGEGRGRGEGGGRERINGVQGRHETDVTGEKTKNN